MSILVEISLPDFGDGEAGAGSAVVSFWHAEVGDLLEAGDDLLEIVTDKASFVVPSPSRGVLRERRALEDDTVRIGDVIALMEVES